MVFKRKMRKISGLAAVLFSILSTSAGYAETLTVTKSSGDLSTGSLRQVLRDMQTGDIVRFSPRVEEIILGDTAFNGNAVNLSIRGNEGGTILDGAGLYRIMNLDSAQGNVLIDSLIFQNGNRIERGEQWNGGYNHVQSNGGALLVKGGEGSVIRISNSQFLNNYLSIEGDNTWVRGSAIFVGQYINGGAATTYITDTSFIGNVAATWGFTDGTKVHYPSGPLANGGAVFTSGTALIQNANFVDNLAWAKGGVGESFILDDVRQRPTAAAGAAAGALSTYSGFDIRNSSFINNKAIAQGGIAATDEEYGLRGDASVDTIGGAILSWNNNTVGVANTLSDSLFIGNEARAIGGQAADPHQQVVASGGAIALRASKITSITNTSFFDNLVYAEGVTPQQTYVSAQGGAIKWDFFQNVDKEGQYDSEFHLVATEGKQTVFRGNREQTRWVDGQGDSHEEITPNSLAIVFYDRSSDPDVPNPIALLSIRTERNGLVALDDPFTTSMSTILDMNVDGVGEFRWGGKNVLGVVSETTINFNSGTVTLRPDFSLTSNTDPDYVDATYIVNMQSGLRLNLDLTHRDTGLAMFDDKEGNQFTFNADGVKLSAATYVLDEVKETYLVTNNRDSVDANSFDVANGDLFATTISTNGNELYVSIDNTKAIAPIVNSPSTNVQAIRLSGALGTVYNDMMEFADYSQQGEIFSALRANPQHLLAEGIVTQGRVALDSMTSCSQALWQMQDRAARHQQMCCYNSCDPCASNGCSYPPYRQRTIWGGYIGNHTNQSDTGNYYGYNNKVNGGIFGFDLATAMSGDVGCFFSFAQGKTDYDSLATNVDTKMFQTGVYGTMRPTYNLSIRGDFSYGNFNNDSMRSNYFGDYSGKFNQNGYSAGLMAKRDMHLTRMTLSPYLGVRYQGLNQNELIEAGPTGFATAVDGFHAKSIASTLGTAAAFDILLAKNMVTPTFYADWRHEFAETGFTTLAAFDGAPQQFMLSTVERSRNSANFGGDLATSWQGAQGNVWDVRAGYAANVTTDYTAQTFYATLGLRF